MRRGVKIVGVLVAAAAAVAACGGSTVKGKASNAVSATTPDVVATSAPAVSTPTAPLSTSAVTPVSVSSSAPALPDLNLSDQTASGDNPPEFDSVDVNGKSYPNSMILADCDSDTVVASYPVPEGYESLQSSAAVPDDAATDFRGTIEILVDGRRAQVASPSLGKPVTVSVAVGGATTLTIRSYTTNCGDQGSADGLVLTSPVFSGATGTTAVPKSAPVITYPTEELQTVTDGCDDDFEEDYDTGIIEVNGTEQLHALWAGPEDNADAKACYFEYNLSRSYSGLLANFGVSDNSATGFRCIATITVDGRTVYHGQSGAGRLTPVSAKLSNGLRLRVQFDHFTAAGSCVLGDLRLTK